MYKVRSLEEFINESFFRNLSVGERTRIEAQLVEWSKTDTPFEFKKIRPGSGIINKDLTVDIYGHVGLARSDFKKLPVKFRKVTEAFNIYGCKNLTTLEGCPEEVKGNFVCNKCPKLTSLNGAPKEVGGDFYAKNCGKKFTETEVRKYSKVGGRIDV